MFSRTRQLYLIPVENVSEMCLRDVGMRIYITVKTGEQDWTINCNNGFSPDPSKSFTT